jgi:3-phosphoshikimate 1-carboxyvinyltransferase
MLAGVLAGYDFDSILTGDESLRSRPMRRIIQPLALMAARIHSEDGRPPLRIEGSKALRAISYELPVASAQVKSCILLAALRASGRTEVIEKLGATRDHTERMLEWFGATLETRTVDLNGAVVSIVSITGQQILSGRAVNIPVDVSSAAFLIAAAALLPGSELAIEGVSLNTTRTQFLSTLRSFGLNIALIDGRDESNEPVGTVRVGGPFPVASQPGDLLKPHCDHAVNQVRGPLISDYDGDYRAAVVGTQVKAVLGATLRNCA